MILEMTPCTFIFFFSDLVGPQDSIILSILLRVKENPLPCKKYCALLMVLNFVGYYQLILHSMGAKMAGTPVKSKYSIKSNVHSDLHSPVNMTQLCLVCTSLGA